MTLRETQFSNWLILVLVVPIFILTKILNVMIGNKQYHISHIKKFRGMVLIVEMMYFQLA